MTDSDTPTLEEQILNAYDIHSACEKLIPVATEAILPYLRSDDVNVRASTAFLLGYTEMLSPGTRSIAVKPLSYLALNDSSRWVRAEAVRALGDFKTDDVIPVLVQVLTTAEDYIESFYMLEKQNRNTVVEHLKAALQRDSVIARFRAAKYLVQLDGKAGDSGNLDHAEANQRLLAVFASPTAEESAQVLIEQRYQNEPDAAVRAACINVLHETKDYMRVAPFLSAMSDTEGFVRINAFEALRYRRNTLASDPVFHTILLNALADADNSVKRVAVDIIRLIRLEAAVPVLINLLDDPDEQLFSEVTEALGSLKAREAIPVLLEFVGQDDARSSYAISALAAIGDTSVVPFFIELLQNRAYPDRESTAWQVARLKDPRVYPLLMTILTDTTESDAMRRLAAQALARTRAPEAFDSLVETLNSTRSTIVMEGIVRAFRNLGDSRAEPYLINLLSINDELLQREVVEVLEKIGTSVSLPHLQKRLDEIDKDNRPELYRSVEAVLEKLKSKYNTP